MRGKAVLQEVNLPDIDDDGDDGPALSDSAHPWASLFSGADAMGKGNPKANFVIRPSQPPSTPGSTPRAEFQLSRGLLSSSMCASLLPQCSTISTFSYKHCCCLQTTAAYRQLLKDNCTLERKQQISVLCPRAESECPLLVFFLKIVLVLYIAGTSAGTSRHVG